MSAETILRKPINVAQVRKLSPFRYPGGKTWLIPVARQWLASGNNEELIEPFAGGGIISLTAVAENLVEHATLVELDPNVSAVWRAILRSEDAEWLSEQILAFEVSPDSVKNLFNHNPCSVRERAFSTIVRNRVQRGGILADGAGFLKVGENGRGMLSRWYPQTLANRIRFISGLRDRIRFIEGDAFETISRNAWNRKAAFFFDPPYTVAAKRLYRHWEVDHRRLFELAGTLKGDFLMTYDKTREIEELARLNCFKSSPVAMKNTHHAVMDELLIGPDLSWLDSELIDENDQTVLPLDDPQREKV
jgi:DNA adenine methylase